MDIKLSDLISVLDKIPIWKKLKTLFDKVDNIEKRLAELEQKENNQGQNKCPRCFLRKVKVSKISKEGYNGILHNKVIYRCDDCGFTYDKMVRLDSDI